MSYSSSDLKSVKIYRDNQGSLALGKNPKLYQRSKYIDIKHYFCRQYITNGDIDPWYVPTSEIVANRLTKPLYGPAFKLFIKLLNMETITLPITS